MLTNKDIYKSRDTTVSELVAQMMELKYFDEQFMYYATAYVENDVIKYRLNRSASAMYDFWANSMERHIYPTGVKRHVQLLKVPSGKEEEKAMEVRDTFIIKLQKMFPKELFQMLAALGAVPPTDGAKDLLEQWQDELELCYEEDQICLYAEASKEAYNRKILTDETWEKIKQWVKSRQEQISRNQNVIWNNKKYIYGYLFEQNGQLQDYSNAEKTIVFEHLFEMKSKFMPHTPIFFKLELSSQMQHFREINFIRRFIP